MTDSPDDLYALPLNEFTAARNKLAKETGDASIRSLPKPSKAAWALNQAAREHKGDVARFLHAAERVRAGGGRDALNDLREAEADVRRAAGADIRQVNELLAAAAADPDVGDRLRRGVLTGDEEAGELEIEVKATPRRDEVREKRERKKREAAFKEADEEATSLERDAAAAEEEVARLRKRAETAREKADELKAAIE